ncbi:MAG TPA: nucleoside/nucleotide kinase family protein, partial [Gemmobacter sp.]|nr:nucleoside/nucleotide kinase family protein [Gemmobacter sp.]
MTSSTDFSGVMAAALGLLARPGRHVIAVAGAPGSGKSTLA